MPADLGTEIVSAPLPPVWRCSNACGAGNPVYSAGLHEFFFAVSANIAGTINVNVAFGSGR